LCTRTLHYLDFFFLLQIKADKYYHISTVECELYEYLVF
jgi:hypothetical protein